jgi:hypothetical protein
MSEGIKEEIVSKLIDSVPALLALHGVVLILLGLAGGVSYNQWFPISGMRLRRDSRCHSSFKPLKAWSPITGFPGVLEVTTVMSQLSRIKRIPLSRHPPKVGHQMPE